MKYVFLSASCLVLAAMTGIVQADTTVEKNVQLKVSVPQTCSGSLPGSVQITGFVDEEGKLEETAGFNQSLGQVKCNYPANINVKTMSGALKAGGEACNFTGAYTNCIKYSATVAWGGSNATVAAHGSANLEGEGGPTPGPVDDTVNLSLELDGPGGSLLIGGDYVDTLVVKIGQSL
jgi:hypothetical protein